MQTKVFSICLDMRQSLPFHPFEVTEGDTGNVLHVTLQNDGEPLLLNGCKVVLVLTSSMGFAMQDDTSGVIIGEEAGTFTALLDPENFGPGNVSVDVQVYSGPEYQVLITSTRFDFRCRRSLISTEIIRANAAYPPLMAAAREAREATAAALAAAARVDTDIGELNVQSDWNESDNASDAFIRNKPLLTPFAIGAAEAVHAPRHATGGADALSAADIGAATVRAVQLTLTPTGWAGDAAPFTKQASNSYFTGACHVIPAPAPGSEEAYADCALHISAQADGQLTFACDSKPLDNVLVNVLLIYGNEDVSPGGVTSDADDAELTNQELLDLWNN